VREEIRVRGRGQPVVEKVHITRHGPIITPILAGEPQPLSLRTAADPPARALRSTLRVSTARDWSEFDAALAGWPIGGLNFVYADVDGHVGLRVAGRVPDRAGGTGIAPAPGWDSRRDWAGLLPDAVLPRIVDPPAGWVVTANNRPGGPSDELLSREWPDGYRAQRIEAMLGEAAPHDAASFARMQTDLTSCAAQQLTPLLLATSPASPRDARALAMLRGWDCVVAANSAAAAVYEAWRLALLRRVFACVGVDEVDHQMGLGYIAFSNSNHNQIRLTSKLIGLLAARPAPWPAADSPPGLDWDAALSASLSDAVEDLERRLGPEPTSWAWGRLHTITFEHPLGVGLLKRVLSVGPIPSGGDAETICQSALDPRNPLTRSRSAVSYRFIADVSDWDRCLSALPTGQSGNPASAHYRDQSALWRAGRHHPMPFSPDAVRQATRHKIILMPVREGA
jgi:penicillin amidase